MFNNLDFEKQLQKNQQQLEELLIQNESIDRDVDQLLKELEVSSQQLTQFLSNPHHFTQENWDQLQQEKKKLDAALLLKLAQISSPKDTKKQRASLSRIQPHWLHVR